MPALAYIQHPPASCFLFFQTEGLSFLFAAAYAAFQRVAVASELVEEELRHNEEFADKCGRFWRLTQQTANRAVEAAYVLLRARGAVSNATDAGAGAGTAAAPSTPLVPRGVVPRALRCVRAESRRNLRDWVVLKDSLRVGSFYGGVFRLLREENERRRRRRNRQRQRQRERRSWRTSYYRGFK